MADTLLGLSVVDNSVFRKRVTEFLGNYLNYDDSLACYKGTLPLTILQECVQYLLSKHVFVSIRDMQKTAIRECSVFLSYDLFETYLEGVNKNG